MKIELYIDRRLCDIGDPSKFSVYLKRQLYNPSELNTKDAQASYSITLPATNTNNKIFAHSNVEEVYGKFTRLYDAELIVNGIRVFEGKFKLSEIDSSQYKGNLGVPTPKTARDVFESKNMNELGEWGLNLETYDKGIGFISQINKEEKPDCIFPFALYGLLPRNADVPPLYEEVEQSDDFKIAYQEQYKYIFDKNVRFGIEDFPASVNCMEMIKQLFKNQKYKLTGSAFGDQKLQNLYVSYRNPNEYAQGWNWGDLGKISVSGIWKTAIRKSPSNYSHYERQISLNSDDYGKYFNVNLFNSNNLEIKEIKDSGTNVMYNEYEDDYLDKEKIKYTRKSLHVIIPKSGYYKVRLICKELQLERDMVRFGYYDDQSKIRFTQAYHRYRRHNDFRRSRYELQVMRDYGEGDFKNVNIVGMFSKLQFPQTDIRDENQYPKYYPYPNGPMVIDPCINQNFINGLRWGSRYKNGEWNAKDDTNSAEGSDRFVSASPNYMFIANGFSWDKTFSQKTKILSAYDSSVYENGERLKSNYWKWGVLDIIKTKPPVEGETEGEIVPDDEDDEAVYDPNFDPDDDSDSEGFDVKEQKGWIDGKEYEIRERYAVFDDHPAQIDSTYYPANSVTNGTENPTLEGSGTVESIIWLERGERLAVCLAGDMGDKNGGSKPTKLWDECVPMLRNVDFTLEVEPYRSDIEWNNFDSKGNCNLNRYLKWDDGVDNGLVDSGFRKGKINLIDFLPSNIRADEWIEQFCKAFNLSLIHIGEDTFELNTNYSNLSSDNVRVIDIDNRAHIVERTNQNMALPSEYRLGFTVSDDEEGYCRSKKIHEADTSIPIETGGGVLKTGSIETNVVEQSSNFSYCWYTQLSKVEKPEDYPKYEREHIQEWEGVRIPIVSKFEVWETSGWNDYKDMVKKLYFDSAQRFWYKTSKTLTLPIGMQSTTMVNEADSSKSIVKIHQKEVDVAMVSNTYLEKDGLELTYENKPDSITRNYFFVPDAGSSYTEVECFLTPDEYNRLNISLVRFNGSLYHAISIDGYDPTCRKPAKLKMIPKMKKHLI